MERVASTLHTTSEHGASSITTADTHTSATSSRLNDAPADLNGLVRFAERRNLVSGRVPSHFKRSLLVGFEERKLSRAWTMLSILSVQGQYTTFTLPRKFCEPVCRTQPLLP
jgi:hypothetical protein